MNLKEIRIDSLVSLLTDTMTIYDKYNLNNLIFNEYATYNFNSAMKYIVANRILADEIGGAEFKNEVKLNYVSLLSTSGLIKEAADIINSIDGATVTDDLLPDYYKTMEWYYNRANSFANDTIFSPQYSKMNRAYADSVFLLLPPNSLDYNYYKGYTLMRDHKWKEAESVLFDIFLSVTPDARLYAIVSHNLASIYNKQGDVEKHKEFLIKSAISDQVCALKENMALQSLAIYLFQNEPEELERAYKYIQISMNDAHFFNNRVRAVQIGQQLPIIVSAYQKKNDDKNAKLKTSLTIISILLVLMAIAVVSIFRQMKELRQKKKELQLLNKQLEELNETLEYANKTKEEYVGLFIDLCSSYIEQLNRYRNTVTRKILANQVDSLLVQSKSGKQMEAVLLDFLTNFDKAFLNLYPTFIEGFNELMNDDEQIVLKRGELLNPELRIFALIRLGISDSSKIASFLRYSPQTIYNYRTKVKNNSKVDRNDFEKYVMMLGI